MPTLIGHRGYPALAPENSRASFIAAARHGLSWVEADVALTRDNQLVVIHDDSLHLFGQPEQKVAELSSRELQKLDAGSWFDASFRHERLLFLPQLLQSMKALRLGLNLELKISCERPVKEQINAIVARLKELSLPQELIISSFNLEALALVQQQIAGISIAPLFVAIPDNWMTLVKALKPASVHCDYRYMSEQQALAITSHYPLYCYTVNSPLIFNRLLSWGIAGVFTDHPQRMSKSLRAASGADR